MWLCEAHNRVNRLLGKAEFPCNLTQLDGRWYVHVCHVNVLLARSRLFLLNARTLWGAGEEAVNIASMRGLLMTSEGHFRCELALQGSILQLR